MSDPAADGRDYFRYCPGEEAIKISNAVCRGRRRSNFHKCKGCQFNDDERLATSPGAAQGGSMPTTESADAFAGVFKAYDVRGVVPDPLSETAAWRIGYATAQFLRTKLSGMDLATPNAKSIVVGRDHRQHSPALQASFVDGVRASGLDVIDIGLIDTSQIYFAVNHLAAAGGVQTTASHNPPRYNGFKICAAGGKPVGQGTGLESIRDIATRIPKHQTGTTGRLTQLDLSEPYKAFVRGFLHDRPRLARPIKVAVDALNGVAGKWFPILFGDVPGLTTVPLNFEHDGNFVHEPNPMLDANIAALRDAVKREQADFGACFDGDADRCVFVDDKANVLRSDLVTALLARVFLQKSPGSAVVFDLRSSRVVREEIERAGGVAVRQRVGHAFMKKIMAERQGVFGGELSGHYYFRDNWNCDSGVLAFIHLLNLVADGDRAVSELIKPLRRLHGSGEINFENPAADATMAQLQSTFADAEIDQLDGVTVQYPAWWFNVRKSNTEPLLRLNLEADTKKLLREKLAELTPLLGKRIAH
ncbi:MAG: phosphomannomutase/phosphoglucomutase [Phycisphaerae bacterium]